MRLILRKSRADLTIGAHTVTKRYRDPRDAHTEIAWYQRAPDACPELIDADTDAGLLVIARHPPAHEFPNYQPAAELAALLRSLEARGIHHRDIHPGNIVAGPSGPLLIDWETAIHANTPSYDLYGPDASGIPAPEIHRVIRSKNSPNGYVMWWSSPHPMSIRNRWGTDIPTTPATPRRPA